MGPEEPGPDIVSQYLFKGEAVTLKHGKEKEWEHEANHQEQCRTVTNDGAGQQIDGDSHRRRTLETNKLALRQVEGQLGLYFG